MWSNFFVINALMRKEVLQRQDFPLGDEAYTAPLLKAAHGAPFDSAAVSGAAGPRSAPRSATVPPSDAPRHDRLASAR